MARNGTNFKKLRRPWQILLDVLSTQARDQKKMTLKIDTSHATGEEKQGTIGFC